MNITRAVILSGAKDLTHCRRSHKLPSVITTSIVRSLAVFATRDDSAVRERTQ